MEQKRAQITVDAADWEEVQALIKEARLPKNFMSALIRDMIKGMLPVMRQAKIDAEEKRIMTEEEGQKRYLELSKQSFEKL